MAFGTNTGSIVFTIYASLTELCRTGGVFFVLVILLIGRQVFTFLVVIGHLHHTNLRGGNLSFVLCSLALGIVVRKKVLLTFRNVFYWADWWLCLRFFCGNGIMDDTGLISCVVVNENFSQELCYVAKIIFLILLITILWVV